MKSLIALLFLTPMAFAQTFKPNADFNFFDVESESGQFLRLADIQSEVKISGSFADTILDLSYANKSQSALQGMFKLQLPEGALIRDFALRIDETWHYGSLVEKHKARQTFEEIVRRGNDPAVLAWKDGATYQVRIFPFPAEGKRWIRVRYWQDLGEIKNQFVYKLPLPAKAKLDTFKLKLDVEAPAMEAVEFADAFKGLIYLKALDKEKNRFGAMVEEKNFSVKGDFKVEIKQTADAKNKVWTAFHRPKGDMTYMATRWLTDLPTEKRQLAPNLLVFLDTSRSVRSDNFVDTLAGVKAFLKKVPVNIKSALYEFDSKIRPVTEFDAKMTFDGGTNFSAVFDEIKRRQEKTKNNIDVVIISDALPTMQLEREFNDLSIKRAQIYFLPIGSKYSKYFAGGVAAKHGGTLLPILEKDNVDIVWQKFSQSLWQVSAFEVDGKKWSDYLPEEGTLVNDNDGAEIYFRWKQKSMPKKGLLKLNSGVRTLELTVDFAKAEDLPDVEYLWAMKKMNSLIPQAGEFEQEVIAHANRYRLVSPNTSYIVLEMDEDYQQFNITKRAENPSTMRAPRIQAMPMGASPVMEEAMPENISAEESAKEQSAPGAPAESFPTNYAPDSMQRLRERHEPNSDSLKNFIKKAVQRERITKKYTQCSGRMDVIKKQYWKDNTEDMNDPWFFIEMALCFSKKGEKDFAFRVLSNLFEISEDDGKALRALGLVGCFQENCDWAVKAFEMANFLRPEEPQNLRDLAWLYAEVGQIKKAIEAMAALKEKKWHQRFPGMDALIARETAMLTDLQIKERDSTSVFPQIYTWITWNNDNTDVDYMIDENKTVVSYQNKKGKGELSHDFTQGFGPEVYFVKNETLKPEYYVNFYGVDQSQENKSTLVKVAYVTDWGNGKVKLENYYFPLYSASVLVKVK